MQLACKHVIKMFRNKIMREIKMELAWTVDACNTRMIDWDVTSSSSVDNSHVWIARLGLAHKRSTTISCRPRGAEPYKAKEMQFINHLFAVSIRAIDPLMFDFPSRDSSVQRRPIQVYKREISESEIRKNQNQTSVKMMLDQKWSHWQFMCVENLIR